MELHAWCTCCVNAGCSVLAVDNAGVFSMYPVCAQSKTYLTNSHTKGMKKSIQKLEETGSFHVQSVRGRKRVNSMVVEEVATAVQKESSGSLQPCSARRNARKLVKRMPRA
ncbi:hypothetical protein TNCV_4510651 [Trichonephila clavipes]|nr:hypothetical protein TNCV_4510651 [Trichonephila clavipes]